MSTHQRSTLQYESMLLIVSPAFCAAVAARLTGLPPKYFPVPIAIMDGVIGIFDLLAKVFPQLEVSSCIILF